MEREEFELLLSECAGALERYVRYRLVNTCDAEDVLQETRLSAYQARNALKDKALFKAWLISIARNKCNDCFRQRALRAELPLDAVGQTRLAYNRMGRAMPSAVQDTLDSLRECDRRLLQMVYFQKLKQAEIARRMNIPIGTVKSRLHTAKRHFKARYTREYANIKGEISMNKLPEYMPEYSIKQSEKQPFAIVWEELMGWFLVPKLGERLMWGMYDSPSGKCDRVYDMRVIGKASVHGVEGVELTAVETPLDEKSDKLEYTFVAQLTDTHCRYLACLRDIDGVRRYMTFLDEDEFTPNWGFGEGNCGNATRIAPKGEIKRAGDTVTSIDKPFLLDIVGRYSVTIGGKTYDCVCVMDIETYVTDVVSEQYIDAHGRTVLWRRFNRDDWAIDSYGKRWSERLPNNERLTVNGATYVHWYDCVTDYIFR